MKEKRRIPQRTVLAAVTAVGVLLLVLMLLPRPSGSTSAAVKDSGSPGAENLVGGTEQVHRRAEEADLATRTRSPEPQREGLEARLSAMGWSFTADRIGRSSAEGTVKLTRTDGTVLVADEVQVLASGEVVGYGLSEIDSDSLQMEFSGLDEDQEKEEGFRIDGNGKILARHAKLRQMLALRPGEDRPF
jgi:hypothetical protein